jgi:hypothetical protein
MRVKPDALLEVVFKAAVHVVAGTALRQRRTDRQDKARQQA